MPRSASTGVYTAPSNSFNPAVTNTTIGSAAWNATQADYVTALAHTASTTRALYPITSQVQDSALLWGGTAGGTADALTITLTPAITAYATGQVFRFLASAANATSTPTLAVNGLAAVTITRADGTPLLVGDLAAGALVEVAYNAAAFRLVGIATSQVVGNDGATTTSSAGSISLTSASSRVQVVTMTADAQSVFLPDARTLSVGGLRYIIRNAGSRTFGLRSGKPNQLLNGTFDTTSSWTLGTGWSIAAGVASKTAGVQSDLAQSSATVLGTSYTVTFTITTISGGTVTPVLTGGGGDVVGTARSAPGTYTETLFSTGNTTFALRGNSTFAGSVDAASLVLIVSPLLAVLPAGAVAECSVSNIATGQGVWTISGRDLSPALTVCDATLAATLTQSVQTAVKLTDTLSLHFARNASGHPFVFAVDHGTSPATVGTAVLIVASNLTVEHAFRVNDTKAFFKIDGTTSNVFNVTVSGTTCTVSTDATAAVFDAATFTGAPLICALGANNDLFVAIDETGTTIRAQAVDASGANPSAGSSVNISALGTGTVKAFAIYRVTASTAIALYIDNSGVALSPFSIRGAVLSLSGTTITVGTSAGVNDVVDAVILPSVQLTATSYIVGYVNLTTGAQSAVAVTVSGTSVTFGTPLSVDATSSFATSYSYNSNNANRFQPNLFRISDTTAFMAYNTLQRCVILSNSSGTLTAGTILFNLANDENGGIFPQEPAGFLGFASVATPSLVNAYGINGTNIEVVGSASVPSDLTFSVLQNLRFGLSGGVRGVSVTSLFAGRIVIFKYTPVGPIYLGQITLPNSNWGQAQNLPIELAASKAAFIFSTRVHTGSNVAAIKFAILEFAA